MNNPSANINIKAGAAPGCCCEDAERVVSRNRRSNKH